MSWDNTAPVAIPAAAAPDNGAPSAVAAAAGHDNTAPGAIAAAAGHNNGAPSSLSAAATAGVAFEGDTTDESAIITNVAPADIANLEVGMGVRGDGIPLGARIDALGATTVTISIAATATAAAVALTAHLAADASAAAAAHDNTAPSALAAAAGHNNGAPSEIPADADFTNDPALPPGAESAGTPTMASVFTPAFVELTGGGNALDTLTANAADAAAGRILQGVVNGELKSYQVRAGTDATALPGIVRPANFNDPANAVVFVQL